MRPRPTARGWGLLAAGLVATAVGVRVGAIDLVRIGLLALLVPAAGLARVVAWRLRRGGRDTRVSRTVTPGALHAGDHARVRVDLSGPRLHGLQLAEQAAGQLTEAGPLRARVRRQPGRAEVSYALRARVRGRWWLGPLLATRTDLLGAARGRTPLGDRTPVPVWPAVVALPTPGDSLLGEADQASLGLRSPASDDAALRDYREGDDLRRVHWTSTARRGQVMVRADEHTGRRPVTVLVGLPDRAQDLDWTLSFAASIALAALASGHRVRLLGADRQPGPDLHVLNGPDARATLLDPLVDLQLPAAAEDRDQLLRAAARRIDARSGELVLAVLGPSGGAGPSDDPLAHLTDRASCWALVAGPPGTDQATAARSAQLRRSGWHTTTGHPGDDLPSSWLRLRSSP
jgi:uncharacterized protein (DUF58 family)